MDNLTLNNIILILSVDINVSVLIETYMTYDKLLILTKKVI
jgi:hypothetical protein